MKKFILPGLLSIFCCALHANSIDNIYSVNFTTIDGKQVTMSSFAGKQIVIVAFDAANPNQPQLKSLDSLSRNSNGNIVVIAIPVSDFGIAMNSASLLGLVHDTLKVSFPVASISKGQAGTSQHPLMQWLTTKSEKNHFSFTFNDPGEMFIVSSAGLLYAIIDKQMPVGGKEMLNILNNPPAQ